MAGWKQKGNWPGQALSMKSGEKKTAYFRSDPVYLVRKENEITDNSKVFIVGFENTMHFLAAPLPCQMFHLGFVFHFLTTDRLSSCGVKCPSCVGGWLQRPYCLKTGLSLQCSCHPQRISMCPHASGTEQLALCMCVVSACVHTWACRYTCLCRNVWGQGLTSGCCPQLLHLIYSFI